MDRTISKSTVRDAIHGLLHKASTVDTNTALSFSSVCCPGCPVDVAVKSIVLAGTALSLRSQIKGLLGIREHSGNA
jgi:hypothetical protein